MRRLFGGLNRTKCTVSSNRRRSPAAWVTSTKSIPPVRTPIDKLIFLLTLMAHESRIKRTAIRTKSSNGRALILKCIYLPVAESALRLDHSNDFLLAQIDLQPFVHVARDLRPGTPRSAVQLGTNSVHVRFREKKKKQTHTLLETR